MKVVAKVLAGVAAGYIVTAICMTAATALLRGVWPTLGTAAQGPALEVLDFAYAILFIGVGGYVALRLGGIVAVYAFGSIVVLLSVSSAVLRLDTDHSAVYLWMMVVGAPVAIAVCTGIGRRGRARSQAGTAPERDPTDAETLFRSRTTAGPVEHRHGGP